MKCSEVHKDLIFYIEGDLSPEREKALRKHLDSCSDCRAYEKFMRQSLGAIEMKKDVPADDEFAGKVLEKMSSVPIKTFSIAPVLKYAAAAAVIVLGVFTGMGIANLTTNTSTDKLAEAGEEYYYHDEMEPIESFFLIKYDEDE
ncbi:MAG: zf-HC2 domain-containing protein [Bacteroidales bacterium]|nr:zf-HC2 domain-containing protein [Bacteroidales bacterium]